MVAILAMLAALARAGFAIGRVLAVAPLLAAAVLWHDGLPAALADEVTRDGWLFVFDTAALVALIGIIDVFGRLLKHTEKLPRLMRALLALFRDGRVALAGMPSVIGLLPMPGGAMVSAPMVEEIAREAGPGVTPEDKTLVNYWFRHTWEYFFPVYPAVFTAARMWQVEISTVMARQVVLTPVAVAAGVVFILSRVKPMRRVRPREGTGGLSHLGAIASGLAPVAVALALWYGLELLGEGGLGLIAWRPWGKASLCLALALVTAGLAVVNRVPAGWLLERTRACLPIDMTLLMAGAMLFQAVVKRSGAVGALSVELAGMGAPAWLVVFLLPLAAGLLTGIAVAYVTIAFPLLAGLVAAGGSADAASTVLAFVGGYVGVLLSPVHICLVLTREYFRADVLRVYARLAAPVAAMSAFAFGVYFLWRGPQ